MTSTEDYDAIIIGASRAGISLGSALAQAGWRTALIERDQLGGTCVNVGCTPTKTMAATARVAYLAGRAVEYGVQTGPVSVDLAEVRRRKDELVNMVRALPEDLIEHTEGLDLVPGEAHFVAPQEIEVRSAGGETRHLSSGTNVINTGARAGSPSTRLTTTTRRFGRT
jgi:pyruvate/2-oxoglutarate dehydrogenase complex dihydrolipoamide dehydrogenase (E3) component